MLAEASSEVGLRPRSVDLDPPQRSVGGAPVPEVLTKWIMEGLPAFCPQCRATLKFTWDGEDSWLCPGMAAGRCYCYASYEALIGSADGDTVANAYRVRSRD